MFDLCREVGSGLSYDDNECKVVSDVALFWSGRSGHTMLCNDGWNYLIF